MSNYVVEGSATTIKPLSQTQVQKTIEIYAKTVPEGITFTYDFPYEQWIKQGGLPALESVVAPIATDIQTILASPEVASVYYAQDTAANGLLVGLLEVVVQVPSRDVVSGGMLTETIDIPLAELGNPEFRTFTWQAQVAAAVARLSALAAV